MEMVSVPANVAAPVVTIPMPLTCRMNAVIPPITAAIAESTAKNTKKILR